MLKFLSLIILLLIGQQSTSQTITVKDSENHQTIPYVNIYQKSSEKMIQTNHQGKADLSVFNNSDTLALKIFGYKPKTLTFNDLLQSDYVISLTPLSIQLQTAVVTAHRWNQSKQEIPSKISQIPLEEIQLLNPQTAADLLGLTGEVFVQKSQQGGGSPMIRGFSANRLLYTIDGVRMNTAIFRSGNIHNVISLDPFTLENTEVFFGPGAIIYGSDAIGAVMNFQTLTPQIDHKPIAVNAVLRSATVNKEKTSHLDVRLSGKKWGSITSFSLHDFGNLKMGTRGPDEYLRKFFVQTKAFPDQLVANPNPLIQNPSAYSQINWMQKVRFQPTSSWDFQYGFHYSATSAYARYDRHLRFRPDGTPRSAEWLYGPQKWMMHNFSATNTKSSILFDVATFRVAYQFFEESRIDRNFRQSTRRTRTENVYAYNFNGDFLKNVGDHGKWFYGVEAVFNDVNSLGINENILTDIKENGPSRYPNATWHALSWYNSYQHKISKKSLLQGGFRLNSFGLNADFNQNLTFYPLPFDRIKLQKEALTGNLGWVFTPEESWTFHTNFATGFRAPNVDDIGKIFDSEPGTVLIPNPKLGAEYAYSGEINITKVISDRVLIDLTGYYTYLDQAIVRRDSRLNGQDSIIYDGLKSRVLSLQNIAAAKIYGLQAAIEIRLSDNITFLNRLNYQKGIEESDNGEIFPSRHAPPMFGLSRLEYKDKKLKIQLFSEFSNSVSYEGLPLEERGKPEIYAIDSNGLPYSPSWYTINLAANFRLNPIFTLNLGLENIGDVRYRPYSSGIVSGGRNFILSLRASF
jgi:hemoglobin/transferrin/lactoferrin receptor protein